MTLWQFVQQTTFSPRQLEVNFHLNTYFLEQTYERKLFFQIRTGTLCFRSVFVQEISQKINQTPTLHSTYHLVNKHRKLEAY